MDILKIPIYKQLEYINEYDDVERKDISLAEFMIKKTEESKAHLHSMVNYKLSIGIGSEQFSRFYVTKPDDMARWVPRTIFIDGPNIMHSGSTYRDTRKGTVQKKIPDVAALLALMRFFISENFDVVVVISRKYLTADATNNKAALEELVKHNLCVITSQSNLDDTIAVDMAAQVNGIVLSSDEYIDPAMKDKKQRQVVGPNRINIEWLNISALGRNKRSRKTDDFIANKRILFKGEKDRIFSNKDMLKKINVSPEDILYELTKERYDLARPEANKEKRIILLNRLIVDGISQCPQNVKRIINTPVSGPTRGKTNKTGGAKPCKDEDFIDRYEDDYNEW